MNARYTPILVCALAFLFSACPRGPQRVQNAETIQDFRARAAADPQNARLAAELAVAELLHVDGDPLAAGAALHRARELEERSHLAYLAGVDRYVHGDPQGALDDFLVALRLAARDYRADANARSATLAEVAVGSIRELDGLVPAYPSRVQAFLQELATDLPLPARFAAAALHMELAERSGEAQVGGSAFGAECLSEWRVAGPVGPRSLLGFDHADDALLNDALPDEVDLGPGRGIRPVRTHIARACTVHLGDGPVGDGGNSYAQARFDAPSAGVYTIRLETPNAVELRVDGQQIARLDARRTPLQRVTYHRVRLTAGEHRFAVLVSTRHPNPVLSLALSAGDGITELEDEAEAPYADTESGRDPALACYLSASAALARGRSIDARSRLRSNACPESPVLLSLRAAVALSDPYQEPAMARDRARTWLRQVEAQDPQNWFARLQLARLDAAEGRDREAIMQLRADGASWPNVVSFPLALSELLLQRGWDAETQRHLERAMTMVPGACEPIAMALGHAQQRDRMGRIDRLTDALMQCDARNPARFTQHVLARRWEEAAAELDRLLTFEAPQTHHRLLQARLEIAEGHGEGADAVLAELATSRPRSDLAPRAQADRALARGELDAALETMANVLRSEPASMADLRRTYVALGGDDVLADFRLDTEQIIREFEEGDVAYDEPQLLLLDYTAVRVFADGSSLALTHEILKAQSEESVDELGEFHVPDGGYVLQLHTRKADGAQLEPDLIEGSAINLPTVSVGDYVVREYVRVLDPPAGLAGGLLGDRFYFRSTETPYHRSELVVAAPASLALEVETRGDAPAAQRRVQGDLQVLRWRIDRSEPRVVEPLSVNPREFTPSVNWGIHATWSNFAAGLRDVLADRDPRDPAAVALVRRITEGAASHEAVARKLHRWVIQEIEDGGSAFGLAPVMVAARSGHRARVLHYLLRLADVPSELLLVRGVNNDQTEGALADEETYPNLLVRVGEHILTTTARHVPFGYIAPGLRGQDAFVLLPAASDAFERTRVPEMDGGVDRHRIDVLVSLPARGNGTTARLEVVERYQGADAIQWRENLEAIPVAELNTRFEQAYAAQVIPGAQLESLRVIHQDEPSEPLTLRYELLVPGFVREGSDGRRMLPLFPAGLTAIYGAFSSRNTTMQVGPAIDLQVEIRYDLEGATLPDALELEGPGGARFAIENDPSTNTQRRRLFVPMMRVTPGDYEGFASWVRNVDEAERREVGLR